MRHPLAIAAAAAAAAALLSCAQRVAPSSSPGAAAATPAGGVGAPRAYAELEPRGDAHVRGRADFTAAEGKVTLRLELSGLSPGEHAVHLHEKGDCSAPDASSAGGHWNPTEEGHGKWGTHPFHRGDIGNVVAGPDGTATVTFSTDLWSIGGDPSRDVVGRSVIVHARTDDFTTQPTGNAGGRVACGVIVARK